MDRSLLTRLQNDPGFLWLLGDHELELLRDLTSEQTVGYDQTFVAFICESSKTYLEHRRNVQESFTFLNYYTDFEFTAMTPEQVAAVCGEKPSMMSVKELVKRVCNKPGEFAQLTSAQLALLCTLTKEQMTEFNDNVDDELVSIIHTASVRELYIIYQLKRAANYLQEHGLGHLFQQ